MRIIIYYVCVYSKWGEGGVRTSLKYATDGSRNPLNARVLIATAVSRLSKTRAAVYGVKIAISRQRLFLKLNVIIKITALYR